MKQTAWLGVMSMALATLAQAEPLNYGLVSLSESANQSIARDQMVLVLNIEEKGNNREQVASVVTQKVNAVLQEAKKHKQFNTMLQSRSAYPLSDWVNGKRVDRGWQDSASIKLESKNMAALNQFAAQVQKHAAIGNIQYTVSTATMQEAERTLTRDVLQRFNQRAQYITQQLGGSGYKVVQLNVGNSSDDPVMRGYGASMMMAAKAEAAPVQDTAPGEAELSLSVNGQIQVQGLH